jgi:hypothetical protein
VLRDLAEFDAFRKPTNSTYWTTANNILQRPARLAAAIEPSSQVYEQFFMSRCRLLNIKELHL